MKEVYLIRHSEPMKSCNIHYNDYISEQEKNEKIPLSVNGEELALNMASKLFCKNITNVFSSTYERAISTAKYIAKLNNIPINICSLFNERKLGFTENVKDNFWLEQLYDENVKTKDGESRKEVCHRMLKGINFVLEKTPDDSKSVIISHATAMTFLLMNWCDLMDANLDDKKRWLRYNGKDVINDSFNTPEIFKLSFKNNSLIDIKRIS